MCEMFDTFSTFDAFDIYCTHFTYRILHVMTQLIAEIEKSLIL